MSLNESFLIIIVLRLRREEILPTEVVHEVIVIVGSVL